MSVTTNLAELQEQVRLHLGIGSTTARDTTVVETAIKGGLRRFMLSALIPGTAKRWQWSFLRKSFEFSTRSGGQEYDLPEDFGTPDSQVVFSADDKSPIPWLNEPLLRRRYAESPEASGVPHFAAILNRSPTVAPQRYGVLFWPEPDAAYSLRLVYNVVPDMLGEELTNPHGGAPHARTILYACLAEAAKRIDQDPKEFEMEYAQGLLASIDFDRQLLGSNLGPMIDSSEDLEYRRPNNFSVTYEGTLYEG